MNYQSLHKEAKAILKDKSNFYKRLSKEQLINHLRAFDADIFIDLADYFKANNTPIIARKLYLRWHYADGRPKPQRVHEVTRLREQLRNVNLDLDIALQSRSIVIDKFHKKSDKLIECEWQANLLRSEVLSLEAKNRRILRAAGIAFVLVLGLIGLQIFG